MRSEVSKPSYASSIGLLPHISHCQTAAEAAVKDRKSVCEELNEIHTEVLCLVCIRVEKKHSNCTISNFFREHLGNQACTRLSNAVLRRGEVYICTEQHPNVPTSLCLVEAYINRHAVLGLIDCKLLSAWDSSVCRSAADPVPAR